MRQQTLHTCHSVNDLLVSLSEPQHDGGLGEHRRFDLFSVLEDAQRLIKVCSGITYMPVNT